MTTPANVERRALPPDDRTRAILELIAGELALIASEQALKPYLLGNGRVSPGTMWRILHGQNHTIASLIEAAALLDADVEIRILKRSA